MRKISLHIAFAIIILLLALPALQMRFKIFSEKPLNGAFTLAEKPAFSREKWVKGQFQGEVEKYFKDHAGFRNFLVRLQNQVDFSLFKQANAEGAVIGKNKQLFEYDYIRSWLAIDYPGDSFIEKKLNRTKWVQEYLKREKGIDLVVVFEPGKASFYPEYLPKKYKVKKSGASTYERYRVKAEEIGIDFIDFNQYFLQLKPTSQYPLYPRYGTHWSVYGMQFAADSILNFIEKRKSITLTEVRGKSVETSYIPRDTDDDVLKTMNLLFEMKGEVLAYPVLDFDTANPGEKPMVLVIADSYYWNIFNTRIPKYVFANEAFWYFNTLVYPDHYLQPTNTKDINFRQEVEKQQVIFVMITERFLHKFDWVFIDQLYALYTPEWLQDPVYEKINDIMQVAPWYADVIKKADKWSKPLEEMLIAEGKYLYYQSDTAGYMIDYGLEHFSRIITNDTGWMAHITEKAKKQNRSVDEVVKDDATYIFRKDYPGLCELNLDKTALMEKLYSSPVILETLKLEAQEYRFDPGLYIRFKAGQLLMEEYIRNTIHAIEINPSWLEDVKRKAFSKGITVEEMMRLDAEYLWLERLKKF